MHLAVNIQGFQKEWREPFKMKFQAWLCKIKVGQFRWLVANISFDEVQIYCGCLIMRLLKQICQNFYFILDLLISCQNYISFSNFLNFKFLFLLFLLICLFSSLTRLSSIFCIPSGTIQIYHSINVNFILVIHGWKYRTFNTAFTKNEPHFIQI